MQRGEIEGADSDSASADDPSLSSPLPKCQSQQKETYDSDPDSATVRSRAEQFEGLDDQSDSSQLHTPAQHSKRRRIPTPSPIKSKGFLVGESDSDGFERDDLYSTPSRKRGFSRPRAKWSLVQEWSLEHNERKDIDEEIENILKQSLADSQARGYIKPNLNAIAGFRQKQVRNQPLIIMLAIITNLHFLFFRVIIRGSRPIFTPAPTSVRIMRGAGAR